MLAQELVSIVGLPTVNSRAGRRVHLTADRISASSISARKGFTRKAAAPASRHRCHVPFVALCRQDHNGNLTPCCPEMAEEVEAAPAHPEIEDQAPDDLATGGA
jgi:hypothetical protein